jgi:hypothetical protein
MEFANVKENGVWKNASHLSIWSISNLFNIKCKMQLCEKFDIF